MATTSAADIERIVCEVEASRPSSVANSATLAAAEKERRARARRSTPRAWAYALRGDLDRILLKALRKEPRLRYATVEQLAADLQRYLKGEPVLAQPDTFAYRCSKFVRRNRTAVAGASLLAVALCAGLVLSLVQNQRIRRFSRGESEQRMLAESRLAESERLRTELAAERNVAEERLRELQTLNLELGQQRTLAQRRFEEVRGLATTLIFDLYDDLTPLSGTILAQEAVVATGLSYLDRLAQDAQGHQPLLRELNDAYCRIAEIQGGWGQANQGQVGAGLQSAEKALSIANQLLEAAPENALNLSCLMRATSIHGNLLRSTGQEEKAAQSFRAAVERGAVLLTGPGATVDQLYAYYANLAQLAECLQASSQHEDAIRTFERCKAVLQRIIDQDPNPRFPAELNLLSVIWAQSEQALQRPTAALELLLPAVEALEIASAQDASNSMLRRHLRSARSGIALVYAALDECESARAMLTENLAELTALHQQDPHNALVQHDSVREGRALIRVYMLTQDWTAALELGERLLPEARALLQLDPQHARTKILLAALLDDLGQCQGALGLLLEASQSLLEARELLEAVRATDASSVEAQGELARAYIQLGYTHHAAAQQSKADALAQRRSLEQSLLWFERALALRAELQGRGLHWAEDFDRSLRELPELIEACKESLKQLPRERDP